MRIMDCTLRDGANVVGKGFDAELTDMMIRGLIKANILDIEMGNCLGVGAYEANGSIAPLTDQEYFDLIQPYLSKAKIGMFIGVKNANERNIEKAAKNGVKFLRIGANAGDTNAAHEGVKLVKKYGMEARFAMMKGYIAPPEKLADEAKALEDVGLDLCTIMDSAGTMTPDVVKKYCHALSSKCSIPIAFHGHNNLGLSVANALAAFEGGAEVADCGLMGMARSAGNCATEILTAVMRRDGKLLDIDFYALLRFIDEELMPAMEKRGYHCPVKPIDLVYGYAGCHSSFAMIFSDTANEKSVDLFRLIVEVSKIDRKNPTKELIESVADTLK